MDGMTVSWNNVFLHRITGEYNLVTKVTAGALSISGSEGLEGSKLRDEQAYLKTLKSPNIHHVIAALWDHTHHFYSFLQQRMEGKADFKTRCWLSENKRFEI